MPDRKASDVTDTYLPTAIQNMVDSLTHDAGQAPSVTRTSPLHYHLELANTRVTLTITWRRSSAGKWKWKDSTLAIDGQQRAIAKSYDDFIRIWGEPDQADIKPEPAVLPELTPLPDDADLPSVIATTRDAALNRVRDKTDTTLYVARTDRGYTLAAHGPKGHIRVHYSPGRTENTWRLDPAQPFQILDADGIDQTAQFAGDLHAALASILGAPTPEPAGTSKARNHRAAAVSNSVTVRRHSVIRV
jgi:hypothetical protein